MFHLACIVVILALAVPALKVIAMIADMLIALTVVSAQKINHNQFIAWCVVLGVMIAFAAHLKA